MLMLSLLSLFVPYTFAACPTGWIPLENSCYMTSQDQHNFFEGQEFCWEQGGYLAEISGSEENELVKLIIVEELNYWIGLTDQAEEMRWIWQESHQEADWFNWAEGEPNNFAGENCVALERSHTKKQTGSTGPRGSPTTLPGRTAWLLRGVTPRSRLVQLGRGGAQQLCRGEL